MTLSGSHGMSRLNVKLVENIDSLVAFLYARTSYIVFMLAFRCSEYSLRPQARLARSKYTRKSRVVVEANLSLVESFHPPCKPYPARGES